ncbi:aspartic peptidase domain-containing protein [Mycena galopus ATCC 62051]|nr:aspartic peptidase domain-containing protein [Mycena galopus ATCC 62051]
MPQIYSLLVTLCGLLYLVAALAIEERATPAPFSLPVSRTSERYQAGKRSFTSTLSATHAHGDILVNMTFGSQTLPMLFDTGSSELWVMSTYYTGSLSGDLYYNIGASTTWTPISGYTYSVNYGTASSDSAGVVGTDKVSLGGITVTGGALGAANSGTPSTSRAGIIGMPRGSMTVKNSAGTSIHENTFMQNIASSLPAPIFAAYLPWGTGAAASCIDFGYIDSTKYTGTLSTVPLISSAYWAFTSTSYYVNGVKHSVTSTTNGEAIIDTGTTLLRVYPEIASTFYAGVTGAYQDSGTWVFPCSTTTFPSLTLDVGGVQASVIHEIDFGYWTTLSNGTEICEGGIQVETSSLMVFGEIFLASNYVVFNDAAGTIQIANIVF